MGASVAKEVSSSTLKECTLWKADRSPACRSVMMVLDALDLNINEVDIDLDKQEQKTLEIATINHINCLPILKDKELVLGESNAISLYLAARYGDGKIMPKDPGGLSKVSQLLFYNNGVLYPRYQAAVCPILNGNCKCLMPQNVADIESSYSDLEKMLLNRSWFSNCPWPMINDICLCASISTLNAMVPVDSLKFPRLNSWLERMSQETYYLTANQKGLGEFSRRIGELELLS